MTGTPWVGLDPLHGLTPPVGDPDSAQETARRYAAAGQEAGRQAGALRVLGGALAREWQGPAADAALTALGHLAGQLARTAGGAERAAAAWTALARATRSAQGEWAAARALADTALAEESARQTLSPAGADAVPSVGPPAPPQPSPLRAAARARARAALGDLERAERTSTAALRSVLDELPDPDAVVHLLQSAKAWSGYALTALGSAAGGVRSWQQGLDRHAAVAREEWTRARVAWRADGGAASRAAFEDARAAGRAARALAGSHAQTVVGNDLVQTAGALSGAAKKVMPAAGFALDLAAGDDGWHAGAKTVLGYGVGRAVGVGMAGLITEGTAAAAPWLAASVAVPVVGEVAVVAVVGFTAAVVAQQLLADTEVGQAVTDAVADGAQAVAHGAAEGARAAGHAVAAAWGWVTG